MATNSQRPKGRDNVLSALNVFIEVLNVAKEASCITPAQAVFTTVVVVLVMIRVRFFMFCAATGSPLTPDQESMVNQEEYVDLGLNCAEICAVLDRGTKGKRTEDINQSVLEAINQLTTWVEPVVRCLGS